MDDTINLLLDAFEDGLEIVVDTNTMMSSTMWWNNCRSRYAILQTSKKRSRIQQGSPYSCTNKPKTEASVIQRVNTAPLPHLMN